MIKRTVEISTPGLRLSSRNRQLVITLPEGESRHVPFEDLGVLILGTPAVSLSGAVLADCLSAKAVVVLCGTDHLPRGMLLPAEGHSVTAERTDAQIAATERLKGQLWKRVVQAKIRAQASLLPPDGGRGRLLALAKGVRPADRGHAEAEAARYYWPRLFLGHGDPRIGMEFRRNRSGPPPNGLLNYGYAVLRAATARAICAAGLNPSIGIHHRNRYDAHRLADDLMEPFRPWVDRRVRELVRDDQLDVNRDTKEVLLGVLTDPVVMPTGRGPLLVALERLASSLASCFLDARKSNGRSPSPQLAEGLAVPCDGPGELDEPI